MVNKQDETIADSMAQQKEHQKPWEWQKGNWGFYVSNALMGQLLNLKKGHEGLSIHPTLSTMWKLWVYANMNLMWRCVSYAIAHFLYLTSLYVVVNIYITHGVLPFGSRLPVVVEMKNV
jgi:hypothetical protein